MSPLPPALPVAGEEPVARLRDVGLQCEQHRAQARHLGRVVVAGGVHARRNPAEQVHFVAGRDEAAPHRGGGYLASRAAL